MTLKTMKKMIRLAIEFGMSKENAFLMAESLLTEERDNKLDDLTRFRYEINAEEQRRSDGSTTER